MKGIESDPTVEAILSLFLVGTPPPTKAIHPKPVRTSFLEDSRSMFKRNGFGFVSFLLVPKDTNYTTIHYSTM